MIKEDISYFDSAEGDLVYETESGKAIVEQDGKAFFVKIYLPQDINWRALSSAFMAEVNEIYDWGQAKDGKPWGRIANSTFVKRVYENVKYHEDDERDKREPYNDLSRRLHSRFFISGEQPGHWSIYENDEEYLMIWQGEMWMHMDDVVDKMRDSAYSITSFLRSWYDRVNGIIDDHDD